jgi:hypothetical protein
MSPRTYRFPALANVATLVQVSCSEGSAEDVGTAPCSALAEGVAGPVDVEGGEAVEARGLVWATGASSGRSRRIATRIRTIAPTTPAPMSVGRGGPARRAATPGSDRSVDPALSGIAASSSFIGRTSPQVSAVKRLAASNSYNPSTDAPVNREPWTGRRRWRSRIRSPTPHQRRRPGMPRGRGCLPATPGSRPLRRPG